MVKERGRERGQACTAVCCSHFGAKMAEDDVDFLFANFDAPQHPQPARSMMEPRQTSTLHVLAGGPVLPRLRKTYLTRRWQF